MVTPDEIIASWLEDVKSFSDTNIIISVYKYKLIPENNPLNLINLDNFLDTELNTIYSNLIEYFYKYCIFIPDLMFKFLKEETEFFTTVPYLKEEYKLFNDVSEKLFTNVIELKASLGNKKYELLDVQIEDNMIHLRFENLFEE